MSKIDVLNSSGLNATNATVQEHETPFPLGNSIDHVSVLVV